MGNIINYVREYGRYTFQEKAFNSVDSLVLSELSYLKYDVCAAPLMDTQKELTFKQIADLKDEQFDTLFEGLFDVKGNMQLLQEVAKSVRFGESSVSYYVNLVEPERETQFAAMIFFLTDHIPFIAFRGTDETLTGWKENFNMAFMSPVPAQEHAVKYMEFVIMHLAAYNKFYMGGHSKGGNVAVYAAMHMERMAQRRIARIYSLDGPGFKESVLEDRGYLRIAHRILKIIPQSSLIGMLLEHQERYRVVESSQKGILQHDPFSWIVKNGDFKYLAEVDKTALFMDRTLNKWLEDMDDAARERLVTIIFDIIAEAQMSNATEMLVDWKNVMKQILETTTEQDEATKKILWNMMKKLMELGVRELFKGNEKENLNGR